MNENVFMKRDCQKVIQSVQQRKPLLFKKNILALSYLNNQKRAKCYLRRGKNFLVCLEKNKNISTITFTQNKIEWELAKDGDIDEPFLEWSAAVITTTSNML